MATGSGTGTPVTPSTPATAVATAVSSNPSTLTQIRSSFIREVGRYDFVTASGQDAGANEYINCGCRYLDQALSTTARTMTWHEVLAAGTLSIVLAGCMYPKSIWISNEDGWARLSQMDLELFRQRFPAIWADLPTDVAPPVVNVGVGTGVPAYYAISTIGLSPDQNYLTADAFEEADVFKRDYADVYVGDWYNQLRIIFSPIPDEEYSVRVYGVFRSQVLTVDSDKNYWTVMHPDMVIAAAALEYEGRMRNSQGQKDIMLRLSEKMRAYQVEISEREWNGIDRILA